MLQGYEGPPFIRLNSGIKAALANVCAEYQLNRLETKDDYQAT